MSPKRKAGSKRSEKREREDDLVFAETAFVPDFLLRPVITVAKG